MNKIKEDILGLQRVLAILIEYLHEKGYISKLAAHRIISAVDCANDEEYRQFCQSLLDELNEKDRSLQ